MMGRSPPVHVGQLSLHLVQPEDVIEWSERDIQILQEGILFDALRSVLDRRNGQRTREELWSWIDSDAIHPFSFRVCASSVGADPDELREAFHMMAERALRQNDPTAFSKAVGALRNARSAA